MITEEKLDEILTNDRRDAATDVRAALLIALDIRKELTRIGDALLSLRAPLDAIATKPQSKLQPRDVPAPGPGNLPIGEFRSG